MDVERECCGRERHLLNQVCYKRSLSEEKKLTSVQVVPSPHSAKRCVHWFISYQIITVVQ